MSSILDLGDDAPRRRRALPVTALEATLVVTRLVVRLRRGATAALGLVGQSLPVVVLVVAPVVSLTVLPVVVALGPLVVGGMAALRAALSVALLAALLLSLSRVATTLAPLRAGSLSTPVSLLLVSARILPALTTLLLGAPLLEHL